jgi:hypothetical protein
MRVPERVPLPLPSTFMVDKDPAYYGRYRLMYDQVAPQFQTLSGFIQLRAGHTDELDAVFEKLTPQRQNWPFHRINRGRNGAMYSLPDGPPEDDFLELELVSDVCYIDMRNLRWAMEQLAPHLEDAHFFVLSTGDGEDRWCDEYRIQKSVVRAERWIAEPNLWSARLDFYHALAKLPDRRNDAHFRAFVAYCKNHQNR